MTDLFELYGSQRIKEGLKRLDGIPQDRMVIGLFSAFVGLKKSVRSITTAEVRNFRNILAMLPPNCTKQKQFRGMTLQEIAKRFGETSGTTLSPVTQARYMSTLSPFFRWLKSEGYATQQPFDGLHQRVVRGKNPRPPFTTGKFIQILTSPLYGELCVRTKSICPGTLRQTTGVIGFLSFACLLLHVRAKSRSFGLRILNKNLAFGCSKLERTTKLTSM